MALRAVIDHPKFLALQEALNRPRFCVLGILETIWHYAGRFTPQGDIGKYSDVSIEKWLEWDGKPGELIANLVRTGWLDADENCRLLVHDWHKHSDKATKNSLKRNNLVFCTPTVRTDLYGVRTQYPLPGPVPVPEPEAKALSSAEPTIDTRPVEFFDAWNRLSGKLPKVETFGDSRRKKVQARLRQGVGQVQFEAAVRACTEKPFLRGENDRGWTATFDWLIDNDRNIEKALNEYNGGGNNGGANGKDQRGPTSDRVTRNRIALAKAAIELGWVEASDFNGKPDAPVSESGARGDDQGIYDRLRETGPEILPPEG